MRVGWLVVVVVALAGCESGQPTTGKAGATPSAVSSAVAPRTGAKAPPPAAAIAPIPTSEFARLFGALSEPDRYFFSDNLISNETSYLDVLPELERLPKGMAYLGVGPEQNFAYIAALQPQVAFILDIRRDNALLHLLYKSCFEEATSRAHFLSLVIGRDYHRTNAPQAAVEVEAIIADVTAQPRDSEVFERIHERLLAKIATKYSILLTEKDRQRLRFMHQTLFEEGLDVRFELHAKNGRPYPMLRELLAATDAQGQARGFLASEAAFRTVQRLERENRIIPVVGDFAGPQAVRAIAEELKRRQLQVAAFYVSNVEQYLLEPQLWKQWVSNVETLPRTNDSVFIRAYLDQGKPHPKQRPGHRSTTLLQPLAKFPNGLQPPASFYAITAEGQ